ETQSKPKGTSPPTSFMDTFSSPISRRFNREDRNALKTPNSPTATSTLVTFSSFKPTPALRIPEILLSIASYLTRSTLARCASVCREWHHTLQPLLFKVIQPNDFDRPEFIRAFQDHTRFATSIEWIQEPPGKIATSQLKKQAWHQIFRKNKTPKTTMERTFKQLETSLLAGETPSLGRLSVRIQNQDPNLILRLPASTVTSLQISTRGYPVRKPKIFMEDLLLAYPHLVHLTLEGLFTLTSHLVEDSSSQPQQQPQSSSAAPATLATTTDDQTQSTATTINHAPVTASMAITPVVPSIPSAGGVTTATGAAISLPFAAVLINPDAQQQHASASTPSVEDASTKTSCDTNNTIATTKSVAPPSAIKTLNLRLVDISQDGLISIAPLLPRLEGLLIEEFLVPDMMIKIYRWNWSSTFIQSFRSAYPHLRSLRLAIPFDTIREDTIVQILKSFPLLTTVGFRNSWFSKRAMETLEEYCPLVESLDVSFGCAMHREFKGALLRFLQRNTKLKELEADGVLFHLDTPIDDDVQRTPRWACSKLEKLVCGFQGTGSMIFQHLSQFLEMKSLTISYPPLSLSPYESTVAWMSKNSKMEYFWYSQYRHLPFDRKTFEWMVQHWPNLKTLHVAGGMPKQGDVVRQWCKDSNRQSLLVEYDRV
ncbi:hypothetical protein BGZ83_011993, partial [Gryganskiella cystojenkinii]